MTILIASSNIFRRELSSFVLAEAGYTISEVSDAASLLAALADARPALLVIDSGLGGAPEALAEQLSGQTSAPILWIASSDEPPPVTNGQRGDSVLWPYQSEEFLARIRRLLSPALSSRSVGAPLGAPEPDPQPGAARA